MAQPTRNDWKIDVPLTNVSIAYMQAQDNYIADRVFPVVPVDRRSDKYYIFDKNDWLRDEAQERPPATESAGSGYNLSTDSYYCDKPAIHKDVDNDDIREVDNEFDFLRDAAEFTTHRLLLRREIQWASDYFATNVWDTDVTPSNLWSDYTNGDPISDIETGKRTILENTGFSPNKLVVGYEVWEKLKHHPDFVDRYKHTTPGGLTTDLVAQVLELDEVLVCMATKATNVEGGTAAYDFIQGKHALLCYANPRPSRRQPSAGYMFAWRRLNPAQDTFVRTRQFEIERLDVIRVESEEAYDFKVTGTDLGYFFNGAVA